jgi:carboxylesterase type B
MTIFAMTTMIILLCLLVVVSTGSDSIVTLQTRLGNIKGISSTFTLINITKPYTIFRNIPFAQAPIGELRFRKPVPYGSWNGTLDATQFGPSCVQSLEYITEYLPNKQMSEDCLVLNVFVPSDESNSKKSVILWIHGGGYLGGQGMAYDGSYLDGIGNVIVVTINYRLEAFGFFSFSTGDDVAPGNYGL